MTLRGIEEQRALQLLVACLIGGLSCQHELDRRAGRFVGVTPMRADARRGRARRLQDSRDVPVQGPRNRHGHSAARGLQDQVMREGVLTNDLCVLQLTPRFSQIDHTCFQRLRGQLRREVLPGQRRHSGQVERF